MTRLDLQVLRLRLALGITESQAVALAALIWGMAG